MPLAILSALTLGLSIDFAIHFVQRFRHRVRNIHNTQKAISSIFNGPARAILRNAVIIAIGFTPLIFAPLVPYVTVGAYLFAIMLLSAVATLILLPAAIGLYPKYFEKKERHA
jgi:hypothetical protein